MDGWMNGKELKSYRADFECLCKLYWLSQRGPQSTAELFSWEVLVVTLVILLEIGIMVC